MRNIWLIARREYLERVRTKAFVISTVLFPLLFGSMATLPAKFMTRKTGGTRNIVVVASSEQFGEQVRERITNGAKNAGRKYIVEVSTDTTDAARDALRQRLSANQIDGFLWTDDAAVAADKVQYVGKETSDFMEIADYEQAVNRVVLRNRLAAAGVTSGDLDQLMKRVSVDPVRWEQGKESHGTSSLFVLGIAAAILIYTATLMYGVMVLRSVLEEKSSRIVEVMLATVSANDLMAGKVLGVAAAGLTQLAIWAAAGSYLGAPMLASMAGGSFSIPTRAYIGLPAFFLLGFLLYSSLFAALGACVNSEQEAQQFQMIVMLPLIMTMAFMYAVIRTPNSQFSVLLSLFPLTSPVLMYLRLVISQPPAWQIAASVAILLGTFCVVVLVCARIYRVGILMYGKRPTLPEIMRWLRYA